MEDKIKEEGRESKFYGKMTGIAVLFTVAAIFCVWWFSKPEMAAANLPIETESIIETESETETLERETKVSSLKKDAYPEIQVLMERYFEAKMNCDVEALKQIVNPLNGYTVEGLENDLGIPESEAFRRVENYQNITCYTKPGLLPDTYIVWVYYETKYVNVETAAPCMFKAYICTDEMGVYIYNGAIEGEISNYLDEASRDDDVAALVSSVNQQLTEACNQDENLKHIYDILWGVADPTEPAPQETETQPAE